MKDKQIYEPPRFMTIKECVEQLLEVENNKG
jgi:diphthamide biosynthesis methyltransferase